MPIERSPEHVPLLNTGAGKGAPPLTPAAVTQHSQKRAFASTGALNLSEETTYAFNISFSGRTLARKGRHHGNSSDREKTDATD